MLVAAELPELRHHPASCLAFVPVFAPLIRREEPCRFTRCGGRVGVCLRENKSDGSIHLMCTSIHEVPVRPAHQVPRTLGVHTSLLKKSNKVGKRRPGNSLCATTFEFVGVDGRAVKSRHDFVVFQPFHESPQLKTWLGKLRGPSSQRHR